MLRLSCPKSNKSSKGMGWESLSVNKCVWRSGMATVRFSSSATARVSLMALIWLFGPCHMYGTRNLPDSAGGWRGPAARLRLASPPCWWAARHASDNQRTCQHQRLIPQLAEQQRPAQVRCAARQLPTGLLLV